MYGAQALREQLYKLILFENDVEMYGAQARACLCHQLCRLRMM